MWKFAVWKEGSKILPANLTADFSKQLYLKKDQVNQPEILYFDWDSGKVYRDLKNVGKVGWNMLWVSQDFRLINELYIKMESINQLFFFVWRLATDKWNCSSLKVWFSSRQA